MKTFFNFDEIPLKILEKINDDSSLIRNSEQRLLNYKKLLEEVNKNKDIYNPNDDFIIWYKDFLRENKNREQIWLRNLIEEKTYINQGLNPPFCY